MVDSLVKFITVDMLFFMSQLATLNTEKGTKVTGIQIMDSLLQVNTKSIS
jgi:hypothetical protein